MPFGGLLTAGILTGVSAYGAHKKSKQANKAAEDQAKLNNAFTADQKAGQEKILSGLQANGWNPFGVNQLTSGGTSSSTSNSVGSRDVYSKENPFTTPEYQKMDELVRGVMENRLSRGTSLPPGYEANAIRKINEASASGESAARNIAARKGLSGQQVFGLSAPAQAARTAQIADLRGNVPLLERQMMNEDIGIEGDRQARFGTGRETRSHEDSRSRTNTSGSQSGYSDSGPNIAALSSLLMPPGAQQSTVSPYSGAGSAFDAAGQAGSALFGTYMGNKQASPGSISGGVPSNAFNLRMCPDGQFRAGC